MLIFILHRGVFGFTPVLTRMKNRLPACKEAGVITADMYTYALREIPRPAKLHLLPKVHLIGVPRRLVISGCGSLTENLRARGMVQQSIRAEGQRLISLL